MSAPELTDDERTQIEDILYRRAGEIAAFRADYTKTPTHFGSVELALTREIDRLRHLSDRVAPPRQAKDDDE